MDFSRQQAVGNISAGKSAYESHPFSNIDE
jgi:hypothetical protein